MNARGGIVRSGVVLQPVIQRDDVQGHQVLALVLMDPLDLDVEHPHRVEFDAGGRVHVLREPGLVGALDFPPALPERGVVGVGLQPAQPAQVGQPAVADRLVEQPAQARVGQRQEPSRRHTVGDVAEPLRPHLVKVFEHTGFQQIRVQRGDTVDGVAADGGQVRHPHALAAVLTDQRHPADPLLVAGELRAHLVEEALVDLVDQLQVARQRLAEHATAARFPAPRAAACGWCSRRSRR